MKKIFLTACTLFTLAFVFSISFQGSTLSKNSAFAAKKCCYEQGSMCSPANNGNVSNHYYSTKGCGTSITVNSIQ